MSKTDVKLVSGMSFADYANIDAVNASTLLTYWDVTPAEARHGQTYGDKDTTAKTTGSATHAAILEPDTFEKQFIKQPSASQFGHGDFRTKAAKEARDEWLEEHKDAVSITSAEYDAAIGMREATLSDPFLSSLLTSPGKNELTLTWTDAETELPCKARVDRITAYRGWNTLIDVKTAMRIDNHSVQKAMAMYHYHIRMAWYMDALQLRFADKKDIRVFLMWVLNKPPHIGRVTEIEEDGLREGRMQYRRLLALHAKCLKENSWPGYPVGEQPLDLPAWAFRVTGLGG